MLVAAKIDWNKILERYIDIIAEFALNLVIAILIIGIGFKIISILVKLVRKAMEKRATDYGVVTFACSFLKISLRAFVLLMAVGQLGVQASSIIALLGSFGVAVGLALQGSLSNVAGGVLLLMLKPFQVGDYIVVDGTGCEGEVSSMDIFYTKLKTIDNRVIVIPNGTLSNSNLINNTKQDRRLIDIQVDIGYDADMQKAKDILTDIAAKETRIMDQEGVRVFVKELAHSSVILGIRCWVATDVYVETKWALNEEIKKCFDQSGIEIPYQKLDVCIKTDE